MDTTVRKHLRIKSKVRFAIFILMILFLSATLINSLLSMNSASALSKTEYTKVKIVAGDTLWNIANEYRSSDTDIRQAVHIICAANDITASDMTPGMTLDIPVSKL